MIFASIMTWLFVLKWRDVSLFMSIICMIYFMPFDTLPKFWVNIFFILQNPHSCTIHELSLVVFSVITLGAWLPRVLYYLEWEFQPYVLWCPEYFPINNCFLFSSIVWSLCCLVAFSVYLPCVHLLASVLDYFLTSGAFGWKLPWDLVSMPPFLYGVAFSASQWLVALNDLKQTWC